MDSNTIRVFVNKLLCKRRIPTSFVIASDQIKDLDLNNAPFCAVINTSPSHIVDRGHWVCVIFWRRNYYEFFDSYGKKPEYYRLRLPTDAGFERKIASKDIQGYDSSVCGLYCIEYLVLRSRGYSVDYFHNLFNMERSRNDKLITTIMKKVIVSGELQVGQICCSRRQNNIQYGTL